MNNYNLSYFGYIESEGKWVRWATNWFYHDDTNMTQKNKIGFYELSKTQYCCLINDENRLVMYMCPTTGTLTTLNFEEVAKSDVLPDNVDETLLSSSMVIDSSTIIFHVQESNKVYMFNGSGFSSFDLKLNQPALDLKYSQRTGKYFAFCLDGVFTADNIMGYFTELDSINVFASALIIENDNTIVILQGDSVYTSSDGINWELQYDQIHINDDMVTITKLGNIFVIYKYENPKELYYSDTAGKNWKKYTLMTGEELFDGDSIKETKISITEDHAYIRYYPNSDKHAKYYVSEDLAEWRETNVPCKEDTTLFEMSAFPCGLFIY